MKENYGLIGLQASFYVPSFHANAHVVSCIMKHHPKNYPNLGIIDGEDLERLWSGLGNFSQIVRNMSKEGRREQLEDAFMAARRRSLASLGSRLKSKYKKIKESIPFKEECLRSFKPTNLGTLQFEEQIQEWINLRHAIQDPQRPVPLISQLKAFIASRYNLLKTRKENRGQVYLQKIMKSIIQTKRKIQAMVSDGLEEDVSSFEEHTLKDNIILVWLEVQKAKKELTYLLQDLERLSGCNLAIIEEGIFLQIQS
jgi:hypothetical protein